MDNTTSPPGKVVDVSAGVIFRDGLVLVARRPDHDALGGLWEFPGGKVEPGESPEQALIREIQEELGISIQIQSFLGETLTHQKTRSIRLLVWTAILTLGEPVPHFHREIAWVSPENLSTLPMPEADIPFIPLLQDPRSRG